MFKPLIQNGLLLKSPVEKWYLGGGGVGCRASFPPISTFRDTVRAEGIPGAQRRGTWGTRHPSLLTSMGNCAPMAGNFTHGADVVFVFESLESEVRCINSEVRQVPVPLS
jgi:hypothetical protein